MQNIVIETIAKDNNNELYFNNFWNKYVITGKIKELPFRENWNNDYGNFDDLVLKDLGLKAGEVVFSISDDNRPIIIIGTCLGNAIFFKRLNMDNHIVHCSVPYQISIMVCGLLSSTSLSEEEQKRFINIHRNIGHYVEDVKKFFSK